MLLFWRFLKYFKNIPNKKHTIALLYLTFKKGDTIKNHISKKCIIYT